MASQLSTYAVAALALYLSVSLLRNLNSPLSKVPGPPYTKLTSLWLIIQEITSNRRSYIHSLHQKYGPVVRLSPNEVSVTSVEAIKEIYTSGGSGYDKTEFYDLFMQFGMRTMFSTLGRTDHSQKKRSIAGSYAKTNILRPEVLGGIQERAHAFAEKCIESRGGSLDVYIYLHCYALDCTTYHLFHTYSTKSIDNEEGMKLMKELSYHDSLKQNLIQYYAPTISSLPFVKFFPLFVPRPSPLSNAYVHATCSKPSTSKYTLLHALQHSPSFSLIQVAAECMDHLAAGIDTTGDALCFLMYQLSLPSSVSIQEKLSREARENQGLGNEKRFDELPYLDAVVKEGLRCFPPIPMSQPRYVPEGGRTIDGYLLPAKTVISAQAWSVHRINAETFEDPDEFCPERWLCIDERERAKMNKAFFAFGLGARGCTGRHLAIAEMKILMKEVYSRFRTRIAVDMNARMDISDQIISSRPLDQSCKLVFERIERG